MATLEITKDNKQLIVRECDISGSDIMMVMMNNCKLENVMATKLKIADANLTDLEIKHAQLGGAYIHDIGLPPEGHPAYDPNARQRPLKFEDCDLNRSTIVNCDLTGVELSDCNTDGMTINGILVSDLIAAYNNKTT